MSWARWRKRAVVLVALVLLLAGLHSFVTSQRFGTWLASGLEFALAEALGEEVLLGQVRLELAPPRAHVKGLVVTSARDGTPLASLESASATLGWSGGPVVEGLDLVAPVLRVRLSEDGLRDFTGLAGGDAGGRELPLGRVGVQHGRLVVERDGEEVIGLDGLLLDNAGLSLDELRLPAGQRAASLHWPGAVLDGRGLHAPEVRLELPLGEAVGQLELLVAGEVAGRLDLSGELDALGPVVEPVALEGGSWSGQLELSGTLADPLGELRLAASPVLVGPRGSRYELGELDLELALQREFLEVESLRSDWADGVVTGQGRVGWDGELRRLDLQARELSLYRAFQQAGEFPDPHVDMLFDLELQLAGQLSPLELEGLTRLRGRNLTVGDDGLAGPHALLLHFDELASEGAVTLDDGGVRLHGHALRGEGNSGSLQAWLPFDPVGPFQVDVVFERARLQAFRPLGGTRLEGVGGAEVHVAGPWADPDVEATVEVRDFGMFGLDVADRLSTEVQLLELERLGFPSFQAQRGSTRMRGQLLVDFEPEELELELDALVGEGRVSDLVGPWLELPGVDARVEGVLSLSGPPSALDGEADLRLANADLAGERFDEGRLVATVSSGFVDLRPLELRRADGTLELTGQVAPDGALDLRLTGGGFRLERSAWLRAFEGRLDGVAELEGAVGGSLGEPEPRGQLRLQNLHWMGRPAPDLQVDFRTRSGRLLAAAEGGRVLEAEGELDLWGDHDWTIAGSFEELPLDLLVPRAPDGGELRWTASGMLVGAGTLDQPAALSVTVREHSLAWREERLVSPSPFQIRLEEAQWSVRGLRLVGEGTNLRASLEGGSTDIWIEAQGPFDAVWLGALDDTISARGEAQLDLGLHGPVGQLGGEVRLQLERGAVRASWFPDGLEALDLEVLGRPEAWTIEHGRGELGGGPVELSGLVRAQRWVPVEYALEARIRDARVEPLPELPPLVADARLQLLGPADALQLTGEVVVLDMVFAERLDWEQFAVDFRESRLEEEAAPARAPVLGLDVAIRAERSARLRNNLGEGVLDADLRLVGDDTRVGLTGTVGMQPGGRAFFQGREFEVLRAELRYVDPFGYDPEVDVLLETQVRGRERDYDISVPLRGPLSDMRTEPRSDPQLPAADINALLLFGRTRDELESAGGAGAALAAEGLDVLVTGEGTRALERLGPDALTEALQSTRVELNTGVSERGQVGDDSWRVLVETEVQEPLEATMVGEFSLDERYLAVEKELVRNLYLKLFWSSEQRKRRLDAGGAYGADVEVRWDSE